MNIITIAKRHHLTEAQAAKVKAMETSMTVTADAGDPYLFTARVTTEAVDRQNEVVVAQGGDLTDFLATGGLFYNHEYAQPVGFPNKTKGIVRGPNYLDIGFRFMQRPADFVGDFAPDFARAYVTQGMAAGMMPGVSIGFLPIESRRATKGDIAKYGEGVETVHSKWKLLEVSIAPVQANQDAGVIVVGKAIAPAKPPVATPPPKKTIHAVCVIRRQIDHVAVARTQVEREFLKSFGKVYSN